MAKNNLISKGRFNSNEIRGFMSTDVSETVAKQMNLKQKSLPVDSNTTIQEVD